MRNKNRTEIKNKILNAFGLTGSSCTYDVALLLGLNPCYVNNIKRILIAEKKLVFDCNKKNLSGWSADYWKPN